MVYQKDFEDRCWCLNARNVEYLIVGGYALAFHGVPGFTNDIDFFVKPAVESAAQLLAAPEDFGFRNTGLTAQEILAERRILELGRPPVQVHIVTQVSGVSWEDAWATMCESTYGHARVFFIGRDAFVANKKAAGRPKDLGGLGPPQK